MNKITLSAPALIVMALLAACRPNPENWSQHSSVLDSLASCPYISSDTHNRPVISYVAALNDSVSVLRYRISHNDGISFAQAIEIGSSTNIEPHGENLPKVIFKPDNVIIAVWGSENATPQNKYAGKVFYSQSADGGRSWTPATPLVNDPGSYDQRYFDVALLPDGEAGIVWLDSRESSDQKGSTAYFARTRGAAGFTGETVIAESICPCCRTDLFVDEQGAVYAAFRDIINDTVRDMVVSRSMDGGRSFGQPGRISADNWVIDGCPHTGPSMTESDGVLHFSWYTGAGPGGVFYCRTADGLHFSQRDSVSGKRSARHPQIRGMNNKGVAIVWDESVAYGDKVNARIGLQLRDNSGNVTEKRFLSPDSVLSQFPVIGVTARNSVIVAFTQRAGDRNHVAFYRSGK